MYSSVPPSFAAPRKSDDNRREERQKSESSLQPFARINRFVALVNNVLQRKPMVAKLLYLHQIMINMDGKGPVDSLVNRRLSSQGFNPMSSMAFLFIPPPK
jgi:hypothetical protein